MRDLCQAVQARSSSRREDGRQVEARETLDEALLSSQEPSRLKIPFGLGVFIHLTLFPSSIYPNYCTLVNNPKVNYNRHIHITYLGGMEQLGPSMPSDEPRSDMILKSRLSTSVSVPDDSSSSSLRLRIASIFAFCIVFSAFCLKKSGSVWNPWDCSFLRAFFCLLMVLSDFPV
jgi:hypothetical protein